MLAASTASAWPSSDAVGQVLQAADAARGDHGNADRVRHGARQAEVEAGLGAVAVHAGEQQSRRRPGFPSCAPTRRRRGRSALRPPWVNTSHLPGATCLASIATTMHCEPCFCEASNTSCGLVTAEVFMLTLSAPALSRRRTSSTLRTPPPTVSGMNTVEATASMIVQDQVAAVAGGGDVEEGDLVGALAVVAARDLDRVAGVAQLGEIDALDDAAVGDVQAGDDAFGEHGIGQRAQAASPSVSSSARCCAVVRSSVPS